MKTSIFTILISLLLILGSNHQLYAQTGSVAGNVSDNDGQPLQGATIQIQGTSIGTASDSDGSYLLEEVSIGDQTLVVSFIGYTTQRRQVTIEDGGRLEIDFTLSEDLLGLDEVIVSGTFNPATKLESSTAITTLDSEYITNRIPRGSADLLRAVPGMQVISNYGEMGADVTVRGLPKTENSSFRYISLQEDGLPAFEPPGLLFAFPDAYVRQDETIARVEAVRGGTAPIFSSNTPGGIINFISKTGGPELGGLVKSTVGTQGMARLDMNVGGPLMDQWRFNIGGYYRHDEGVRNPGYPVNRGGQLKLNLTRYLDNGYIRFYGKYLNEKNVWFMGIPFQNYKDPEPIPGGPEFGTGTTFSPNRRVLTLPDAFHRAGFVNRNMDEGLSVRYKMFGLELVRDLGNDWNLTLRSRMLSSDNSNNLMVDVADPFPIAGFAQPALPAEIPRFVRFVNSGETITNPAEAANLNGNGLMSVHGLGFSDQEVSNFISNLQLSKQVGSHELNAGAYFSSYRTDWQLVQAGVFLEVANRPRLIQVMIPTPDSGIAGLTPANGFAGVNTSYWNLHASTDLAAFYIGDDWNVTDRLHINAGLRLDINYSDGANERPVNPGSVEDGEVVGQELPPGYPAFIPTPEQSQRGMFGSGRYRTWDYTFTNLGGSLGINYKLSDHFAIYARGSRGNRAPTVQQWTFQATEGSQITGNTVRGKVEYITQVESGIKVQSPNWSLLLTGFYSQSENLISNFHRGQADGSFEFIAVTGNTRTFGTEIEAVSRPLNGLVFRLNTTLQDPRFTKFQYGFFVPGNNPQSGMHNRDYSGNKLNDIASVLVDFSTSYSKGIFNIFGNYRYTGERQANRPNTITLPGYGELMAGIGLSFEQIDIGVRGTNLLNTQAISLMAQQTGEDVLRVNDDGTADMLVTSGPNAGTVNNTFYSTGQGILPRMIILSATYRF